MCLQHKAIAHNIIVTDMSTAMKQYMKAMKQLHETHNYTTTHAQKWSLVGAGDHQR